jgi:hypothetical protein
LLIVLSSLYFQGLTFQFTGAQAAQRRDPACASGATESQVDYGSFSPATSQAGAQKYLQVRGRGPTMERTIPSVTGKIWKVIGIG